MKTLSAFALAIAGLFAMNATVAAQDKPAPAKKHAAKKASGKKAAPAKAREDDDPEPDVAGHAATKFDCELGNQLTIYRQPEDDQHIALRWKNRLHQMTRVQTSTGANRYENSKQGLVWIGIPAKSMLLDSKKGQQLANECKSPEQLAPKMAEHQHQ